MKPKQAAQAVKRKLSSLSSKISAPLKRSKATRTSTGGSSNHAIDLDTPSPPPSPSPTSSPRPRASVEDAPDEDDIAGSGENPLDEPEEDDEELLSKGIFHQPMTTSAHQSFACADRRMKGWKAAVYAFYAPEVGIEYRAGRRAYIFKCAHRSCKYSYARYSDTGDATATGSMRRHAECCWGPEIWTAAQGKTAKDARPIVEAFSRSGTITDAFERNGKGKVSYSIRQHTSTEAR